ncbi:hypothetical protein DFR47_11512 [Pseudochrobactrum asaccharolyticum]|uniref:Uncharacterized protein n=1 Tax=Pseudochrobactrum asaccharolyticum TaxID=354351 RepID=A0A366DI72_9HYPH|nr:hypothetical protein DFR47_11512 [Pseudochrobactrum asaccharolyticum]
MVIRTLAASIKASDYALHESIKRARDDARETNYRLDRVLAALAQNKK